MNRHLAELRASGELAERREMLGAARWAADAYAGADIGTVRTIVDAVADEAARHAAHYAEWAVRETSFGVVEHKRLKNELCSRGVWSHYRGQDFVTPRADPERKLFEIPRPAGVVLALTPSTNPIATLFVKIIFALMTRNAIVVSPHPMARECCVDAALRLGRVAEEAGAPPGVVHVIDNPTIPLVETLMADPRTDVILATGGVGVVAASLRSGNPALGVGPGNVPALVERSADLDRAARKLVESKSFDNSVLCTNESVLLVDEPIESALMHALTGGGAAQMCDDDVDRLRAAMYPDGRFDTSFVGKSAEEIARRAGLRVPQRTRVLLVGLDHIGDEDPFAREKLCPVLGVHRVGDAERGIAAAKAVLRAGGRGHSAVIHTHDALLAGRYAAALPVMRVVVNEGGSTGSAGFGTHLAPTMTIGTGFAGRSGLGENLEPRHLVNWSRLAYSAEPSERFPDVDPARFVARPGSAGEVVGAPAGAGVDDDRLREAIRRLVIEEYSTLLGERA